MKAFVFEFLLPLYPYHPLMKTFTFNAFNNSREKKKGPILEKMGTNLHVRVCKELSTKTWIYMSRDLANSEFKLIIYLSVR